jgi:hypothetical protein
MAGRDVEADVTQHDMVIEGERDSIEADRKRVAEAFLRISAVVFEANIDARAAECHRRCSAPALHHNGRGAKSWRALDLPRDEDDGTRACASSMIPTIQRLNRNP